MVNQSKLLPSFLINFIKQLKYEKNQHLTNFILLILISSGTIGAFLNYNYTKKIALSNSNNKEIILLENKKVTSHKSTVLVDRIFLKRLITILSICIPSWKATEIFSIIILTFLLISRTMLSVYIAEIAGSNAQSLVSKNWKAFGNGVISFFLITIPAAAVNSFLKYSTSMLSLRFRKRLTNYINNEYLKDVNFYKACNLGGESRIDNADQRVTADIEKFSTAISELYTTVSKPTLDVILFTRKLSTITGWQGPLIMYCYFIISGIIKKSIMPPLGKLTARESELEGNYRTAHQRLIVNSEEIAFYNGSKKERTIINALFDNIYNHSSYLYYLKCLVGIFDGLLVKYWATIIGYIVMATPLVLNKTSKKQATDLTNDYVRNSSYLMGLAAAVGQLVLIGTKISSLVGYTSRVSELLEMVNHLDKVGNEPFDIKEEESTNILSTNESLKEEIKNNEEEKQWILQWKERMKIYREEKIKKENHLKLRLSNSTKGGNIIFGHMIKFEHVDIVSPEGKLLVKDLSFEVPQGRNVMVTGPNGSGKSSLFRVIGQLWPLQNGTLIKPRNEDVLFVPQKPYQVLGTLRDQIIYPHSVEQMIQKGVSDNDLEHLLKIVDPSLTIRNQWHWDEVKDWINTFSGGQKQRIAMARVFYHCPLFAILDECTSAVSDEVEGKIYETCKKLGITLFTVSHRPGLKRFHDAILRFDGRGNWEWEELKFN
jgi:ATP-binding cassette subfamily D (ALD) protein 3